MHVAGTVADGTTLSVGSAIAPVGANGAFAFDLDADAGQAIAIRADHPTRGTQFYVQFSASAQGPAKLVTAQPCNHDALVRDGTAAMSSGGNESSRSWRRATPRTCRAHAIGGSTCLPRSRTGTSSCAFGAASTALSSTCSKKLSSAIGKLKVEVKVEPEGTVSHVSILTPSPGDLGACVQDVMSHAVFPTTRDGGSFGYPFVFPM